MMCMTDLLHRYLLIIFSLNYSTELVDELLRKVLMCDSNTKKGENNANARGSTDTSVANVSVETVNSAAHNSNYDKRCDGSVTRDKDDVNDHTDSDCNGNDNENNDDICKKNDEKKCKDDGVQNDDNCINSNNSEANNNSIDKNNNNCSKNDSNGHNGDIKEKTENSEKGDHSNDVKFSTTLSSGLLLNNPSHPRNLDPHSTLMVVKKSMMDQPPKLFFSVCQALGAVCYVFLAELVREKLKCLECRTKKIQNANSCGGESNKIDGNYVTKNEEEEVGGEGEGEEENVFNDVCVYGCKSEERSLSCVRQITLILVAVLRHGVVKVNNKNKIK